MGDNDMARSLLGEVIQQGSPTRRRKRSRCSAGWREVAARSVAARPSGRFHLRHHAGRMPVHPSIRILVLIVLAAALPLLGIAPLS